MPLDDRSADRPHGAVILKPSHIDITDAESAILAPLWRRGPLSFVSLIEDVKNERAWADATIKTLLHRLMQKGAVKSTKEDGRSLYHPLIPREAYVEGEVQHLVDRLFNGDANALIAFLEERRTPSDR